MVKNSPSYPPETPKAAQAFADYVELGPSRTLRKLAAILVTQSKYRTPATAMTVIQGWSRKYQWQNRLAEFASLRAEQMLREAADLDADTFLKSSQKLNRLVTQHDEPRDVVSIRESVRKPAPKANASVDVVHSGTVKHAHFDMSAFSNDEVDQLALIAERQKEHVS